ncbi:MAG TPA: hypothetical protein VHX44_04730 [Planctomycetota bacterium]|nr:hypothetical protein [Planctomycetota bacterium]
MSHLLLILVLFSDPSGEMSAQVVTEELARIGGKQVEVVMGAEAIKRLERLGMKTSDLVVSPTIANHLTASEKDLVIIRLDRRSSGGDEILESKVWSGGKADSHVSIAGKGGDPLAGSITGIIQVIGPRLPTSPDIAPNTEDAELATLAQGKEWKVLAERLDAKTEKDPRQLYYLILARAQLGQQDAAREALGAMRTAYPAHFLTRAAETLIPAARAPGETPAGTTRTPLDDGSNTLRDAPAVPKDDGSNVLR